MSLRIPHCQAHHGQQQEHSRGQHAFGNAPGRGIGGIVGAFRRRGKGDETRQGGRAVLRVFLTAMTFKLILTRTILLARLFQETFCLVAAIAATTGIKAGLIAGCCKRRFIVLVTVLGAANFVAALFIAPAFCCRILASIVFAIACRALTGCMVARIGGRDRTRLDSGAAEIRQNFLGLDLTLAQSGEIVSDRLLFIQPNLPGIRAYETFIENSAGKLVKVFVFESTQHAGADFCGVRDGIEREATLLALLAKFFPECSQGRLRRARFSQRPHPDASNHRRMRTHMPEGIDSGTIRGTRPPGFRENVPSGEMRLLGFFRQSDGEVRFASLRGVVES